MGSSRCAVERSEDRGLRSGVEPVTSMHLLCCFFGLRPRVAEEDRLVRPCSPTRGTGPGRCRWRLDDVAGPSCSMGQRTPRGEGDRPHGGDAGHGEGQGEASGGESHLGVHVVSLTGRFPGGSGDKNDDPGDPSLEPQEIRKKTAEDHRPGTTFLRRSAPGARQPGSGGRRSSADGRAVEAAHPHGERPCGTSARPRRSASGSWPQERGRRPCRRRRTAEARPRGRPDHRRRPRPPGAGPRHLIGVSPAGAS